MPPGYHLDRASGCAGEYESADFRDDFGIDDVLKTERNSSVEVVIRILHERCRTRTPQR